MTKSIFRKKALEKLSSPDNINELVKVTSSRSWIALFALVGLVIVLCSWAIFGKLPKNVSGQGILIQSGGIAEVTLLGSGIVNQILVSESEYVHKGDTLAIVAQPELQIQIDNAKEKLFFLKAKRNKFVDYNIKSEQLKALYVRKYNLEDKAFDLDKQMRLLEEQLASQEELYKKNLASKKDVNRIRVRFIRMERNNILFDKERQKVNTQLLTLNSPEDNDLEPIEQEISEVRRELEEYNVKYTLSAYVKSPYEGKIIELMTKKGQLIELGSPVVSVEVANQKSQDLEAVVYVSPNEGKKVREGMSVHIAPSTVKVEEYGYIEGEVSKVSEYPSTKFGMARVLGNASLVETFSKDESPIAVTVKLINARTPSQFKWTSAEGPNIEINAGTLCDANIIIKRQSPISFIFGLGI